MFQTLQDNNPGSASAEHNKNPEWEKCVKRNVPLLNKRKPTLLHEKGFANNTTRQVKANIYCRERSYQVKQICSWMLSQQPHLTVCAVLWQSTLLHTQHTVGKVDEMDNTRLPIMKDLPYLWVDFYCSWRLIHFYIDLPAQCSFHAENTLGCPLQGEHTCTLICICNLESPACFGTKAHVDTMYEHFQATEAVDQIQDQSQMKSVSSKASCTTVSLCTSCMCTLLRHLCYLKHQWLRLLPAVCQTTGL